MRRRNTPDPLAPVNAPTWLVVRDALSRPLEVTALPENADRRAILTQARADRAAAGWAVEQMGRQCAFFFCSCDGQRVMIGMEMREPRKT
jgi:hypothetical protein